jgi:alpha-galactosidase
MNYRVLGMTAVFLMASVTGMQALAVPSAQEGSELQALSLRFESKDQTLPFSFIYGGKASAKLLSKWKVERTHSNLDENRTQQTTTYTDPVTHLQVKSVVVRYTDFPAVEWTIYLKNQGSKQSPLIDHVLAMNTALGKGVMDAVLHYSRGSSAKPIDFEPLTAGLNPGKALEFAPTGGRGTDTEFPYYDLSWGDNGAIMAIGWPGQWSARFEASQHDGVLIQAGQQVTHLKLNPGEEIRTPLIAVLFYQGNWIRGQNDWRRWMLAHNTPRPGGQLPVPLLAGGSCPYYGPFVGNNQENQELFIRRYKEEGIKLDYWWIDAGWYPNNGVWTNTGTWEVDKKRFPNGLRAVADFAHANNSKLIVWFEPERVTPDTWLYDKHPEWLLGVPVTDSFPPSKKGQKLLNLGNPEALLWLIDHIDKFITEQHIDVYRQDFNIEALPFWQAHDEPDRQGITENHYVTGYLAYWDELRRRHPDMLIDNCASGGRRLDIESLRRSVPLWRSDYIIEPNGMQNQTYGISFWFPYEGLASQIAETGEAPKKIDVYAFRSDMFSSIHAHWDVRRTDIDYPELRKLVEQWRSIAPDFAGDYYPLTSFDGSHSSWMAWQFDNRASNEGFVQVFRRPESEESSRTLKLQGLEPSSSYGVHNADTGTTEMMTGKQLMQEGLNVELKASPESALILYKKL